MHVNFSKFKKIKEDEHSATFQHPAGHSIKIAKKSLSAPFKKQLEDIPVHNSQSQIGGRVSNKTADLSYADGGMVADSSNQVAVMKENYSDSKKRKKMADGGKVEEKDLEIEPIDDHKSSNKQPIDDHKPLEVEPIKPKHPIEYEKLSEGGSVEPRRLLKDYYADGGEVDSKKPLEVEPIDSNASSSKMPQSSSQTPININIGGAAPQSSQNQQPIAVAPQQQAPIPVNPNPNVLPYGVTPQDLASAQQQANSSTQPSNLPDKLQGNGGLAPQSVASQAPDAQSGYDPFGAVTTQQMFTQGLESEQAANTKIGQAQAALGVKQAKETGQAIAEDQELRSGFQRHMQDLVAQQNDIQHDIAAGHIDPNRYIDNMSAGSKIATGIGLILGGIGGGGHINLVADHLNHMIDQDIAAQQADLGKQENLLSVNLRAQGNLRDATELTRMQTREILQAKIMQDAQKAQSPLAMQQAALANAKLQKDNAQAAGMYAARKTILGSTFQGQGPGGAQGRISQEDPARLIQFLVPPDKQKDVASEIKRATDTRTQEKDILSSFDKAAADMKGLGRIGSALKTPRSLMAFEQSLQPTFGDIEGTVRQSAMDATKENVNPSRYDTDEDTAIKRKALETYIHSKKSAPLAKTFGLDIDRFAGTNVGAGGGTPQPQTIERVDPKSGRIVVYDAATKKPLRFK